MFFTAGVGDDAVGAEVVTTCRNRDKGGGFFVSEGGKLKAYSFNGKKFLNLGKAALELTHFFAGFVVVGSAH